MNNVILKSYRHNYNLKETKKMKCNEQDQAKLPRESEFKDRLTVCFRNPHKFSMTAVI